MLFESSRMRFGVWGMMTAGVVFALALVYEMRGEALAAAKTPPTPAPPIAVKAADGAAQPPSCPALTTDSASKLIELALTCAEKEYPGKPDLTLVGPESLKAPHELWPSFFGCYDWHSSVHGHWSMVRVLKRFPAVPQATAIRTLLDRHFSPENLKKEQAYFAMPHTKLFERPYGWAWFLRLEAELISFDDPDAKRWSANLKPLADQLARQTEDYLNRLSVPLRPGTHGNTAYALAHMLDYARTAGDAALEKTIVTAAKRFYLADTECPAAYEPSGEDFISPCLIEADLMRRVLDKNAFGEWLNRFLPPLDSPRFNPLSAPIEVRDAKDPRIGHLIGLSLQRAASFRALAAALPEADPRVKQFRLLADRHGADGLERMADSGYGGEHWLASFAFYLLTDVGLEKP